MRDRSQARCVLIQSQVATVLMIVADVSSHEPDEMTCAENHDVLKEFATAAADPVLCGASAIKCCYAAAGSGTGAEETGLRAVWSKYSNAQRVSSLHVYRHHERNHPGKENLLLFPTSNQLPQSERKVRSRERLGKLLHFYHREAA